MNDESDAVDVRRTMAMLHRATGVPIMYGGVVQHGRIRITRPLGTRSRLLARLTVHPGRGLGGRTFLLGRPMAVKDYTQATTISHDYDEAVGDAGIRSAIAVPVVVRRTVRAVLYGARPEPVAFGDRAVQAVVAAARDLEQEMVVRDEVDQRVALLREHTPQRAEPVRDPIAAEAVRQAHAELRLLAGRVDDPEVRDRALQACRALMAAVSGADTASFGTACAHDAKPSALAPRELDVLACVALGYTNAEVASQMGVTAGTVKSYLRSAMRKLNARTRLHAVVAARRAGLLP